MKIAIQPLRTSAEQHWQVLLDSNCIVFQSEAQARQFVSTLQRRIQAPHALPQQPRRIAS